MRLFTGMLVFLRSIAHHLKRAYSAHKAAYPEKYPTTDQARELYPPLQGIEERCKPTSVHLQVYDGQCLLALADVIC